MKAIATIVLAIIVLAVFINVTMSTPTPPVDTAAHKTKETADPNASLSGKTYSQHAVEFAAKYAYDVQDADFIVHLAAAHGLTDRQADILNDLQAGPFIVSYRHTVEVFPWHVIGGCDKAHADVIFSDGSTAMLVAAGK